MRTTQALLPGATFEGEKLLAPHQAVLAFRARVPLRPPGVEHVTLADAFGRVLAEDAVAREPHPADPRSMMDGFAIRLADGPGPRAIGPTIRMGAAPPRALEHGEAMRIPTGGVLPDGADAVIPIEDVVEEDGTIALHQLPALHEYVTARGSDIALGDRVIAAGRRLGGPELGVLATLGITSVPVFRRPRVAIISTGDELVDAASTPARGQIRDSNRYAIAGTLAALGAEPLHLAHAGDTLEVLCARIAEGLERADAVMLTGGSSVGERDLTPDAVESFDGPGVIVHGLRVKPGKPTVLAAIGTKPVIGLPGNPTSALMILEAVVAPLVADLTGEVGRRATTVTAVAGAPFDGRPGWTWFVPATLEHGSDGTDVVRPLRIQSAHASLLARAAGYVVLGEDRAHIAAGEAVSLVRFAAGGVR
jgi:molybdopterin molybdotransferase